MIDINKCKIIKELGHGMFGTVFLCEYKNKKYALKIEHILKSEIKKSSSSPVWREIFFSEKFGNKYPDQFIKLHGYDIIDNCAHQQKYKFDIELLVNKNSKERIKNIAQSTICIRKIYSLIDGNLDDILDNLSKEQLYSFILQFACITLLLQKNGYSHGDIKGDNICYVKTNKKYVKILNYKIPTFGYIYKFIDYGFVRHKKNKLSNINKEKHEIMFEYEGMLIFILSILYNDTDFFNYLYENNIKYDGNKIYLQFFESQEYGMLNYLSEYDDNVFFIYRILFTEKFQKSILGNNFKEIIYPKIRGELFDILYFFKVNGNIEKIINYYSIKLGSNITI